MQTFTNLVNVWEAYWMYLQVIWGLPFYSTSLLFFIGGAMAWTGAVIVALYGRLPQDGKQ